VLEAEAEARQRAKGKKKVAGYGGSKPATGRGRCSSNRKASTQADTPISKTERNMTSTYPTGHGSAHWWMFGDEVPESEPREIPDLNEEF
jgi:hypothetical protein